MNTKSFFFNYCAFDESTNRVYKGSVKSELTATSIKEVVQAMQQQGGYPVELSDLQNLSDHVWEDAFFAYQDLMDDVVGFDVTKVDIQVEEKLPQALIEEAEKFITQKMVDCSYYFMADGQEHKSSFRTFISPVHFRQMVEVVKQGSTYESDFALLHELYPETYDALSRLLMQQHPQAYLKELPYQIYEAI